MPNEFPDSASGNNRYGPVPIYRTPGTADDLRISEGGMLSLKRRRRVLEQLDRLPAALENERSLGSVDVFRQRAMAMLASPRTRVAFDLEQESPRTRQRYGDTHWGKSLLTCRRLVESGVRFVQCQATYRLPQEIGRTSNWDDHSVNSHIFNAYREKLPSFDQSVSALIEDIYSRGLDQKVLFVFCGEFGRTPHMGQFTQSGNTMKSGRDHWPSAFTALLAGGGVRGGQVYGSTDRHSAQVADQPVSPGDLTATVMHHLGIDHTQQYVDEIQKLRHRLSDGTPVKDLG